MYSVDPCHLNNILSSYCLLTKGEKWEFSSVNVHLCKIGSLFLNSIIYLPVSFTLKKSIGLNTIFIKFSKIDDSEQP